MTTTDRRVERLQIMLTKEEVSTLDGWRFARHMPSRAAAVRHLLRLGLSVEGIAISDGTSKSGDFGVVGDMKKILNDVDDSRSAPARPHRS